VPTEVYGTGEGATGATAALRARSGASPNPELERIRWLVGYHTRMTWAGQMQLYTEHSASRRCHGVGDFLQGVQFNVWYGKCGGVAFDIVFMWIFDWGGWWVAA